MLHLAYRSSCMKSLLLGTTPPPPFFPFSNKPASAKILRLREREELRLVMNLSMQQECNVLLGPYLL